jgi:cyclase
MRRKRWLLLLAVLIPLEGAGNRESAQVYDLRHAPEPGPLQIRRFAGSGLYWTQGEAGGNTGFLVGADGVLVIDAKATSEATARVVREIRRITAKPIVKAVYTHSDVDVFNGSDGYPSEAAAVCSFGTQTEIGLMTGSKLEMNVDPGIYNTARAERAFRPAEVFSGRFRFMFGEDVVELLNFGAAHTGGDTIVIFPASGVAFIGDLVFGERDPLIQDQKGGYSFGLVRALSILLNRPELSIYVPSHAEPLNRGELRGILRKIEEIQTRVIAMVDAGKSLEDVKQAFGVADARDGYWRWPSLAVAVYQELTLTRDLRRPGQSSAGFDRAGGAFPDRENPARGRTDLEGFSRGQALDPDDLAARYEHRPAAALPGRDGFFPEQVRELFPARRAEGAIPVSFAPGTDHKRKRETIGVEIDAARVVETDRRIPSAANDPAGENGAGFADRQGRLPVPSLSEDAERGFPNRLSRRPKDPIADPGQTDSAR